MAKPQDKSDGNGRIGVDSHNASRGKLRNSDLAPFFMQFGDTTLC